MSQKILKIQKSRASSLRKLARGLGVPSIQEELAKHSTVLRTVDRNCLENLRAHDCLYKDYKLFKEDYQVFHKTYVMFHDGTVKVYKKLRKDLNTMTLIVICLGILTLLNIFLTVLSLFS